MRYTYYSCGCLYSSFNDGKNIISTHQLKHPNPNCPGHK